MNMKNKKNVMIRIDAELVQKAKDLGLNISKVAENALREMIRKLEASDCPNNSNFWRGVRDLNPRGPTGHRLSRPAPYQARVTPQR